MHSWCPCRDSCASGGKAHEAGPPAVTQLAGLEPLVRLGKVWELAFRYQDCQLSRGKLGYFKTLVAGLTLRSDTAKSPSAPRLRNWVFLVGSQKKSPRKDRRPTFELTGIVISQPKWRQSASLARWTLSGDPGCNSSSVRESICLSESPQICIYCTHHTFQNFGKNYISQLYIGKIENKKFFCDN